MTSSEFTLRIAGSPATKQRPRFDPRTQRAYTPPSTIVAEGDIRAIWREAGEPRAPDDVALSVQIVAQVTRPKGHFKKDGSLSAEGRRHPFPRNRKPDLDNLCKTVFDALNSRAYRDDVMIAEANLSRVWGKWPEVTITIKALHA